MGSTLAHMQSNDAPTSDARSGPRQVLFATDGSDSAKHAQTLVASMPWPAGTRIRVLSVVDEVPVFVGMTPAVSSEALRDAVESHIKEIARTLAADGRLVDSAMRVGRPASVIDDEARTIGARLIVLGSRGRGAIASTMLGSVAAEVVDHAPAPVLVVRADSLSGIVLAHDGSDGAAQAEALVIDSQFLHHLPVRVVTAWRMAFDYAGVGQAGGAFLDPATYTRLLEEARQWASSVATASASRLNEAGVHATAETVEASAADGIAAAAGPTDLIVIGTRGQTALARIFLGSVARGVLHRARSSVLIVPRSVEWGRR